MNVCAWASAYYLMHCTLSLGKNERKFHKFLLSACVQVKYLLVRENGFSISRRNVNEWTSHWDSMRVSESDRATQFLVDILLFSSLLYFFCHFGPRCCWCEGDRTRHTLLINKSVYFHLTVVCPLLVLWKETEKSIWPVEWWNSWFTWFQHEWQVASSKRSETLTPVLCMCVSSSRTRASVAQYIWVYVASSSSSCLVSLATLLVSCVSLSRLDTSLKESHHQLWTLGEREWINRSNSEKERQETLRERLREEKKDEESPQWMYEWVRWST